MKKWYLILWVFVFIACDDIVEVQDISDSTVSVLAPTNDAVLTTGTLTLSWEIVEDAENYHVQIATPSFAEALQIVQDSTLINTNFSTTLEANSYEWRVRAENSGYQTNYTTQSFTIED